MGGKRRARPAYASPGELPLFESVLAAAPGGIVHVGANGDILRANAEALRILGLTFDELTHKYTMDFEPQTIWEDGSPCSTTDYPVSRALATGEPQRAVTIGVRRPDGELSWAVFTALPLHDPTSGAVTGAVVTFLDITERKRAEQELRESEGVLRAILQNAPAIITRVDPDGTVRYVNHGVVPGRGPSAYIGRNIFEVLNPENGAIVRACIDRVVASKQPDSYEIEHTPPEGRSLVFSVMVGPIVHQDQVTSVVMIGSDITELRQLQMNLVTADRLAAVGTLAAGVAHEINNPLTYVLFKLNQLRSAVDQGHVPADLVTDLGLATEGAERIARIVRDLGSFSRSAEDEVGPVDIHGVLETAINLSANETRFRATLHRDFGDVPSVLGDESRLGQVFLNLLINAAHAISEGNVDHDRITIKTRSHGDRVSIEISDTGEGIPEPLLSRIFEPFVTTKQTGQGTGLGLHVCHSIISSLNGTIEVSSQPGTGTTFCVTLPQAAAQPPAIARGSRPEIPALPQLRILVVDDEPAIRDVFRAVLNTHDIVTMSSGRDAVAALASGASFDLVFCDLLMPDTTGIELYRQIACEHPHQADAIVFMTGAFAGSTTEFLSALPNPVLHKPFGIDEIQQVVLERAHALLSARKPS